jgi:glycosyltransferase involved in cell wall biosynthesis
MKIAVVGAKGLPPKQGGIEHYCAELYPRIVKQGHSVDLFARSSYTDTQSTQSYDFQGVRVQNLPLLEIRGADAFFASALGVLTTSGRRYDIIHFHALGPSLLTALSKVVSKAKIIVTCHGLDWQRSKWGNFESSIILAGEKTAVRFADRIIVVSEALKSYFLQTYSCDTCYIPTAPANYPDSDSNGSYVKALGLVLGRYIVFLGRLVPEKRPDLLIKAFLKLKPQGWKLVLVGGISDTKEFTASLIQTVAANSDIVMAGELSGKRKAEIIRGSGLFVLPSDVEGLPLAMLEAMREGIPVIASDIAPHQQLIGSDRGILFCAGNTDACTDALNWAISHSQEIKKLAANAQDHVQIHYNWERISAQHLRLYQDLLKSSQYKTGFKRNAKTYTSRVEEV